MNIKLKKIISLCAIVSSLFALPVESATIVYPVGGGTGWGYPGGIQVNTVMLGNGLNPVATTTQGTNGFALVLVNGVPTWVATTTFSSPLLYSAGNVTCQTASGSLSGCLSSTDWTTFNGKGAGTVTSVATNNGLTGGTITTTGTLGLDVSKLNSNNNIVTWNGSQLQSSTSQLTVGSILATTTATSTYVGGIAIGSTTPWGLFSINPTATLGGTVPIFTVGSSTRQEMIIDKFGNVGYGTTTPWASLAVNPIAGKASNQFAIGSSTATSLLVNNRGHVLIGGTVDSALGGSPNVGLQVINNSGVGVMSFGGTGDGNAFSAFGITHIGSSSFWQWAFGSGGVDKMYFDYYDGASYHRALTFDTTPDATFTGSITTGGHIEASDYINADASDITALNGHVKAGIGFGIYLGPDGVDCTDNSVDAVGGIVTACGTYSDQNLKTNIVPLGDELNALDQIPAVSFQWNATGKAIKPSMNTTTPQIGLIAQDIQKVYPQFVTKDEKTGFLQVNYGKLIPVLWAQNKELKDEIDTINQRLLNAGIK